MALMIYIVLSGCSSVFDTAVKTTFFIADTLQCRQHTDQHLLRPLYNFHNLPVISDGNCTHSSKHYLTNALYSCNMIYQFLFAMPRPMPSLLVLSFSGGCGKCHTYSIHQCFQGYRTYFPLTSDLSKYNTSLNWIKLHLPHICPYF